MPHRNAGVETLLHPHYSPKRNQSASHHQMLLGLQGKAEDSQQTTNKGGSSKGSEVMSGSIALGAAGGRR